MTRSHLREQDRLRAWLDDVQLSNRLGCPHYANLGELKADLRVLLGRLDTAETALRQIAACPDPPVASPRWYSARIRRFAREALAALEEA